jgi:tripartite-type tricarboxylate transporter receptor subunit TctC
MNRFATIASYALALMIGNPSGPIWAQSYPSRPIKLIAPYPAGGPADTRARWLAQKLSPVLGQPIVVENKAGAGGTIGTAAVARSTPDGHTLVVVQEGTLALAPHLYSQPGYDPIRDLAPVARLDVTPMLLAVHPSVPAQTVGDLLQLARQRPGQLTYGSAGTGSPPHMAAELFKRMAHIDVVHVPYKGAAPAQVDLIAGQLTYTIDNIVIQLPQVRSGRIKALAVTSARRLTSLPDLPTVSESGLPGYEYSSWMGVCAPAGTPKEIITRLNREIATILKTPEARAWFAAQGGKPVVATPEEFGAHIKSEHARWGNIIREAGIRLE